MIQTQINLFLTQTLTLTAMLTLNKLKKQMKNAR